MVPSGGGTVPHPADTQALPTRATCPTIKGK